MAWTRTDVPRKESYTRQELDEWDEILRRRKVFQPACTLDGATTLASLDQGLELTHFDAPAGRVSVRWIPKPDGALRLEAFSAAVGFDDEAAIAGILAKAVVERLQEPGVALVYWYDATPAAELAKGPTADTRIFGALGAIVESLGAKVSVVDQNADRPRTEARL